MTSAKGHNGDEGLGAPVTNKAGTVQAGENLGACVSVSDGVGGK